MVLVLVVLDVVTTVLDFRGFVRGDVAVAVGVLLLLLRVTVGEETFLFFAFDEPITVVVEEELLEEEELRLLRRNSPEK